MHFFLWNQNSWIKVYFNYHKFLPLPIIASPANSANGHYSTRNKTLSFNDPTSNWLFRNIFQIQKKGKTNTITIWVENRCYTYNIFRIVSPFFLIFSCHPIRIIDLQTTQLIVKVKWRNSIRLELKVKLVRFVRLYNIP